MENATPAHTVCESLGILAYSPALLCGIHGVLEQHRHHHGASASRNWSLETGDLAHLCEIHIADGLVSASSTTAAPRLIRKGDCLNGLVICNCA